MSAALLTMSAFAATIGVNPSTISRAVERGSLPVVVLADGRRMIDRQAADAARRQNSNIKNGHGGRPDRAERRRSSWRAKSTDGYDPAVKACLAVMTAEWPSLIREAMEVLGASELDQARAVIAVEDLTATLACAVHQDINRSRIHDFRLPLPDRPVLAWSADVKEFVEKIGNDGSGGQWTSDDVEGLPGGADWADRSMSACWGAKP
ncbi:hypothetical protein [Mesorhizobium sp. M1396]|uniref:hypothetical protein n=1 Tax=Mesorhizobium sp. M1396 TaxID=2957095 RepID=UPI003334D7F7